MTTQERKAEALSRAVSGQSWSNFPIIFAGFEAKGIPVEDIRPRQNVFTFWAWKELGRRVKKGEHGVRVTTFITTEGRKSEERQTDTEGMDSQGKKPARHSRPWTTTVFHVSQTEPDPYYKADQTAA